MRKLNKAKVGAAALGAAAISLGMMSPALADIAPGSNDVVGAGSDTVQYASDFLWDGTPNGDTGYNTGKTNKVFSFDATADANGRATYNGKTDPSTGDPILLATTSVLRAGTKPVVRPNGSGAGIASLYTSPYIGVAGAPVVNFARASRLPKCSEDTAAANAGYGGLHVFKYGTEHLTMAAANASTNAPNSLTLATLINIYNGTYLKWGDIPTYSGSAPNQTIIPEIPQNGSGTRGQFTADLQAANGGVAVPLTNPNIVTVQENDFASITAPAGVAADAPNAIAPFSGGRIGLNDSGYFGASAANQVKALGGYDDNRDLFFVVRESDLTSAKKFQPGLAANFVNTLFAGGTASVIGSPIYAADIQYAGQTPAYSNLGHGVQGTSCT